MKEGTHLLIKTAQAMEDLGQQISLESQALIDKGLIIYLYGHLGAGKTTLVRGYLRGFNYQAIVKSPTYTIVEPYQLKEHTIYHFDFYRLNDIEELELMGIRDYFHQFADCLIEWPEKAHPLLPLPDITIKIDIQENERLVHLEAKTSRGRNVLSML